MVVKGRGHYKNDIDVPPPTPRISKIASLKRFPDKDYAKSLLHDIAKLVAPIIHENNFTVGLLCEMYPKSEALLGLNINGGAKIMLRLRYHSNPKSFLPIGDIIGTMLHELTHNIHGPHNDKFYKFLDKLKDRFEQIQYNPSSVKNYICEENKLGGSARDLTKSIRDKRVTVLSKGKFKIESKRLGGKSNNGNLRLLALEAAERRLQDSKWCRNEDNAEPQGDELEIIDLEEADSEKPLPQKPQGPNPQLPKSQLPNPQLPKQANVIDLTNPSQDNNDNPDIIVLD